MAPQLKRGDKVYLRTKNLRTKRPSKSLDHTKVGPFLVLERRGQLSYLLDLPKDARVHPVFHISLLEPADPDTPLQTTFKYEADEETEYEVERLLNYREVGRYDFRDTRFIQEWLVKWKGYPESEATWEPEKSLQNCQQLLKEGRSKRYNRHYYTRLGPDDFTKEELEEMYKDVQ